MFSSIKMEEHLETVRSGNFWAKMVAKNSIWGLSPKERTCQTRRNDFNFTSKRSARSRENQSLEF